MNLNMADGVPMRWEVMVKVEINPETFKIIDGKLYLFYNAYFNNTLKIWNKEEMSLKVKADNNWKKIYK